MRCGTLFRKQSNFQWIFGRPVEIQTKFECTDIWCLTCQTHRTFDWGRRLVDFSSEKLWGDQKWFLFVHKNHPILSISSEIRQHTIAITCYVLKEAMQILSHIRSVRSVKHLCGEKLTKRRPISVTAHADTGRFLSLSGSTCHLLWLSVNIRTQLARIRGPLVNNNHVLIYSMELQFECALASGSSYWIGQ